MSMASNWLLDTPHNDCDYPEKDNQVIWNPMEPEIVDSDGSQDYYRKG